MKFPETYAVYDLETTGLNPAQDEAVEIGLLIVRNGVPDPVKTWLLKPAIPLSEETVRITGITQEEVDRIGRPPAECWAEFLDAAKGLPVVGHNIARFDNSFVMACVRRHLPTPERYEDAFALTKCFVDTAALVKAEKLIPRAEPFWYETHMSFAERVLDIRAYGVRYRLGESYQQLGGPEGLQAHRVAGDMAMTNFVYRKLCGLPEMKPAQPALL